METTIEKFYKRSNEVMDKSGDYVVITMSESTYELLQATLIDAELNGRNKKRAEKVRELLNKAYFEKKGKWY